MLNNNSFYLLQVLKVIEKNTFRKSKVLEITMVIIETYTVFCK